MSPAPLTQNTLVKEGMQDVAQTRERRRRRKLFKASIFLGLAAIWAIYRYINGQDVASGGMNPVVSENLPSLILVLILCTAIVGPMLGAGKSPHVLYRPSEINVNLSDVKGAGAVTEEVARTLNLFLAHKTFQETMGGTARRAILFEGPPGTGKTYMAKAMASEAGVPFLFVSSSSFQSMYYGQTNRKIRSYFKALRKYAREEGGAIGFIEEIDAIGAARSGMGGGPGGQEGNSGVVNELLVQMQSFDTPTRGTKLQGWLIDKVNAWLPEGKQLRKRQMAPANILVVGATNRAADLDPALLRPGRFDRTVTFDLPSKSGRREILDYYLQKKSHSSELDTERSRSTLAAMTNGYTPVMLEHLLDEALVWAVRGGRKHLTWDDIQQAKMTEELGLRQPVEYSEKERLTIATHEAGHATIAALTGKGRKLEVLSIIKRGAALGLLAHSDIEETWTSTKSEMISQLQIAMGGIAAEEHYFGEAGTGPSGDLHTATKIAAQMIGAYGMGSTLTSFEAVESNTNLVGKILADDTARKQLEDLLQEAKKSAEKTLQENLHVVEALRDALLERNELVGEEILDIVAWAQLTGEAPVRIIRGENGELVIPVASQILEEHKRALL